jgi:DNA-binding Lrp family transcriptional regulator
MTVGSYVLARFSDPEKLLPAIRTVQACVPVQRWHAVDGHVHLVMKVAAPAAALPDQIKRLDGLDRLLTYEIMLDAELNTQIDPAMAQAYLFLEVEITKLDKVRTRLTAMPEVLFCSTTRGGCDLVALVSGGTFDAIDHIINDKIRMLDGVLRLKQNYVIELTKL